MAVKRTSAPALYELIRAPQEEPKPPPSRRPPRPPDPPARPSSSRAVLAWLGSGRSLRVPVGYMLLAGGAVLGLLVAVYALGYARAERVGIARGSWEALSPSEETRRPGPEVKPSGESRTRAEPTAPPPGRQGALASPEPHRQSAPAAAQPVFSDPRKPGLMYFVIAYTNVAGCERLARFCRQEGLEAYVVGEDSDKLRNVIVLPGFDPSARSGREGKDLEARIHEVGRRWKNVERGASDLSDAYPVLFNPRKDREP